MLFIITPLKHFAFLIYATPVYQVYISTTSKLAKCETLDSKAPKNTSEGLYSNSFPTCPWRTNF